MNIMNEIELRFSDLKMAFNFDHLNDDYKKKLLSLYKVK
jgi:hypothetical protein